MTVNGILDDVLNHSYLHKPARTNTIWTSVNDFSPQMGFLPPTLLPIGSNEQRDCYEYKYISMPSVRSVITMYSVTNDCGGNNSDIKPALTRDQTARISSNSKKIGSPDIFAAHQLTGPIVVHLSKTTAATMTCVRGLSGHFSSAEKSQQRDNKLAITNGMARIRFLTLGRARRSKDLTDPLIHPANERIKRNLIYAKLMHLRVFLSSTPFPPRKNYNHVTEGVNLSAVRCLIHIIEAKARATEQKIPPDYRSSIPWNFSYAHLVTAFVVVRADSSLTGFTDNPTSANLLVGLPRLARFFVAHIEPDVCGVSTIRPV
ncbi:hypothetical protein EAG_11459 [Camponotus floridanus]|uniref:Uncharacterized protein n=1 Tax=Camponotus floridanus TaxID=104421 RepID=E2A9N9_CAMFO|nr:hypothetical protein EAG_11459 [Camponotus floridanus]